MKFKPTLRKTSVSIVILIVWYLLLIFTSIDCRTVSVPCPPGCNGGFTILPKCCECISFNDNLRDFILVVTPGVLVYVIWSLVQKNKLNKKKRGKR